MKSTALAATRSKHLASVMMVCVTTGCGNVPNGNASEAATNSATIAQAAAHPTPAQRCSSPQTYQAVIEAIKGSIVSTPTLTRPLAISDFSAPLVENVDHEAMSIDCSAKLYVPAPAHHPSCAAANYTFLSQGEMLGDGFTFRVQYNLHDTADNTGVQISLPQSEYIGNSMSICVG